MTKKNRFTLIKIADIKIPYVQALMFLLKEESKFSQFISKGKQEINY